MKSQTPLDLISRHGIHRQISSNTQRCSIENKILLIRDQRVILDHDLAQIYGVTTKAMNRAVKRNRHRFPKDFLLRLTEKEAERMRCQNGTGSRRNVRYRPYAFTEHGAFMAAYLLRSKIAIAMSIYVIRAFVRMREALSANQLLEKRLAEIERTLLLHDQTLCDLFIKIRPLLCREPEKPKRRIGFHP